MLKIKNVVAFGLAAAMTFGSVFTVNATTVTPGSTQAVVVSGHNAGVNSGAGTAIGETQTASGTGSNMYVQKKIFKVMVPTSDRMNDIFHYHADPLGLFKEAEGDRVVNVDGDDNGILFRNYDENGEFTHLSKQSDKLTIINLSSSGVELEWQAYAESGGSNAFTGALAGAYDAEAKTFSPITGSANTGTVWFGLKPQYAESVALDYDGSNEGVKTHASVILSSVERYRTVQTGSNVTNVDFLYELREGVETDSFAKFSFSIEGALDRTLSEDTWFDETENIAKAGRNPDPKDMPTLKLIFTPKYIDAKQGRAVYNDDGIQELRLGRSDDDTVLNYTDKIKNVYINGQLIGTADTDLDGNTWTDVDSANQEYNVGRIPLEKFYEKIHTAAAASQTDKGIIREGFEKAGISVATIQWEYNDQVYFANLRGIPDADAR